MISETTIPNLTVSESALAPAKKAAQHSASIPPSTDPEIRAAFHTKRLASYHLSEEVLVIDELRAFRKWRKDPGAQIDIAVVNHALHGIEIKSAADTLKRVKTQLPIYRQCFEKLTFVTAENHLNELIECLPDWCGIVLATKGARGAIHFKTLRRPCQNPEVDVFALSHFLWRKELIACLRMFGGKKVSIRGRKRILRQRLSKLISVSDMSQFVRDSFFARTDWNRVV